MEFIVSRQIAITAGTPEEALEKTKPIEGTSISFNVSPRPQQIPIRPMFPTVPQAVIQTHK